MDKGCLACIDLVRQGSLVWRIEPPDDKWAFEGSPLCDGDNVYVGLRRSDVRPQAHVGCFDAQSGKLKWRRMISSAETPGQGQSNEITSNLLTLDGQRLYYNTNLGAVAALDTRRGQIEWLTVYPRAKAGDLSERATHFYRDLTPCLYDQGKIFVASADAEELWARRRNGTVVLETASQGRPTRRSHAFAGGGARNALGKRQKFVGHRHRQWQTADLLP